MKVSFEVSAVVLYILMALLAITSSALKVKESFLSKQEISHFRKRIPGVSNNTQKLRSSSNARRHGVASLPTSLAHRMISSFCTDGDCGNSSNVDRIDFDLKVRTSLLDGSTPDLVDHFPDGDQVHGDVGFVFLNDNPDAYFQHGRNRVSVKAGKLVTFNGNVTHNTVIRRGQVQLLGPFDMVTFKAVGIALDCCGTDVLADSSFYDNCRAECSPGTADNSTCCGETPTQGGNVIEDQTTYANDCTVACKPIECCNTVVLSNQLKESFQHQCRLACSKDGSLEPKRCCGKIPPVSWLTPESYAKKCSLKCRDDFCFSEANTVEIKGKGLVSMGTLKVGDFVRAGKGEFSRVFSFIHLDRDVETSFLQIRTEGLQKPLELSPDHIVFVSNNYSADVPVCASQVKVGDMLGANKVTRIQSIKRRGIFAPVTYSGDIVVSGVLVSCFAAIRSFSLLNQHTEAHAFFAIRRLVCVFDFDICENERYTKEGIPVWLTSMVQLANNTRHSELSQIMLSIMGLPLISTVYLIEKIIFSRLLIGMFLLIGFFLIKSAKKVKML